MGLVSDHANKRFPPVVDYEEILWTPKLLSPIAWFDPSKLYTMTLVVSSVTQLNDISGNNDHAVQSTTNKKPTTGVDYNGLNALAYDGGDCLLFTELFDTSSAVGAVFAVVDNTAGSHVILSTRDLASGGWSFRFDSATVLSYFHVGYTGVTVVSVAGKAIIGFIRNGLTCTVDFNGTVNTATLTGFTASTFGNTAIGAEDAGTGTFFNGSIGEVICVNSAVSAQDRQNLEGYLAHKWGLAASLPAYHPHKKLPPMTGKTLNYFTPMNLEGR